MNEHASLRRALDAAGIRVSVKARKSRTGRRSSSTASRWDCTALSCVRGVAGHSKGAVW